jgi:hypothetical protein
MSLRASTTSPSRPDPPGPSETKVVKRQRAGVSAALGHRAAMRGGLRRRVFSCCSGAGSRGRCRDRAVLPAPAARLPWRPIPPGFPGACRNTGRRGPVDRVGRARPRRRAGGSSGAAAHRPIRGPANAGPRDFLIEPRADPGGVDVLEAQQETSAGFASGRGRGRRGPPRHGRGAAARSGWARISCEWPCTHHSACGFTVRRWRLAATDQGNPKSIPSGDPG